MNKSNSQAHLENGTNEKIVSYPETDLELNGLEAPDELQRNTVMQQVTQQNPKKPKPTCHYFKLPGHCLYIQFRQLKREKSPAEIIKNRAGNKQNNNIG